MHLKLTKLEQRLLFDAAIAAALAPALAGDASSGIDAAEPASVDTQETLAPSLEQTPTDFYHVPDGDNPVQVLVISSDVDQAEQLAAYANEEVIVVQYDAQSESLSDLYNQVAEALNGRLASSVAFATHGQYGQFHLTGDYYVNSNILQESQDLQQFWKDMGSLIQEGGRLDLLGCYIGQDSQLLTDLSDLFNGIDIAASTDYTGNLHDGNWNLEVGNIDALQYFDTAQLALWQGTLATFIVTNTNDSGAGSLRQAILDAENNPGEDTIEFNIGGGSGETHTIKPLTALPQIFEAVNIDGFSQNIFSGTAIGTHQIILDGENTSFVSGIEMQNVDGGSIKGLVINGFNNNIQLANTMNVTIQDNIIGLEHDGVTATNDGQNTGINIFSNEPSPFNGQNKVLDNIISGHNRWGIEIKGIESNIVQRNYIGTDITGTIAIPNGSGNANSGGVLITGDRGELVNDNIIGGDAETEGNLISGNDGYGIFVKRGDELIQRTIIQGNIIGLDINGNPLGNSSDGIYLQGAADSSVGGEAANLKNVIAYNGGYGIAVDGRYFIFGDFETFSDDSIGNKILENSIFNNGLEGIRLLNDGNNEQPSAEITSVTFEEGTVTIDGIMDGIEDGDNFDLTEVTNILNDIIFDLTFGDYSTMQELIDDLSETEISPNFTDFTDFLVDEYDAGSDCFTFFQEISLSALEVSIFVHQGLPLFFDAVDVDAFFAPCNISEPEQARQEAALENLLSIIDDEGGYDSFFDLFQEEEITTFQQFLDFLSEEGEPITDCDDFIEFFNPEGEEGEENEQLLQELSTLINEVLLETFDEATVTDFFVDCDLPLQDESLEARQFLIQFFANTDNQDGDDGVYFIGETVVTTNSPTPFSVTFTDVSLPVGSTFVTNTATQFSTNNTSQFSPGAPISFILGSPGDVVLGEISLAEPDTLRKTTYYSRVNTYSTETMRSELPWGFIGVFQKNQLTSWGDNIGYGHLSLMGDTIRSFFILGGEPHLSHTSRHTGYDNMVRALNYTYEHFGYENKHGETHHKIHEMTDMEDDELLSVALF